MDLVAPITSIGFFAKRYARDLAALGIATVGDALARYPFRYEDLSRVAPLSAVRHGETVTVRGTLKSVGGFRTPRRNLAVVEALLSDGTGNATLTWFGQRHLAKTFAPGDELLVSGQATVARRGIQFVSPAWEPVRDVQAHVGRIVPVYSVAGNLTPKAMRAIMLRVADAARYLPDLLPADVRERHGVLPRGAMAGTLHFPESMEALRHAERSRDFEQLFLLALANGWLRADLARYEAQAVPFDEAATKAFVARLPFRLTDGQRKAAWQVLQDIARGRPMNRLLDGDVGSGKTLVAAIAALNAANAGCQTVFLVPTAVLAGQHFETLTRLFGTEETPIALLSAGAVRVSRAGTSRDARRADVLASVAAGALPVVVGTHALLEEDVRFARLALAVVDEQHRFGVAQRKALAAKAGAGALPHLLSMTATPIPRTLALAAFGDLALSVIPERPPGRAPVATAVVGRGRKAAVATALREAATEGHQAFVVCPRILEDGTTRLRSVAETATELRALVPELRITELHGRLKQPEKEAIMASFAARDADVLVSTTVIEVGVDVPNATLMVVEGAEQFGLAQLHQLRGRVGRGSAPGRCLLVPDRASPESYARLKLLERCHDGWLLAEEDLRTRGPGETLGTAQTGFGEVTLAALGNGRLREAARAEADALLAADAGLAAVPALREWLDGRLAQVQLS